MLPHLLPSRREFSGDDLIFTLNAKAQKRIAEGASVINATIGALYDDAGKLIRVIEGWPKFEAVPAGGTVAFSVDFSDLDQPPTHYALYFTDLR